jgi:hypothetical protein
MSKRRKRYEAGFKARVALEAVADRTRPTPPSTVHTEPLVPVTEPTTPDYAPVPEEGMAYSRRASKPTDNNRCTVASTTARRKSGENSRRARARRRLKRGRPGSVPEPV